MSDSFVSKENFRYIYKTFSDIFAKKAEISDILWVGNEEPTHDKYVFWLNENDILRIKKKIDDTIAWVKISGESRDVENATEYGTLVITAALNTEGVYVINESGANVLKEYDGEKPLYLCVQPENMYLPYIGNNEFVIDVFGSSIYFGVNTETLACTVSVGEWVSLDENGEISEDKIPSLIIYGYYNRSEGLFYEEETFETLIVGNYKKFFVDIDSATLYAYYKGEYYPVTSAPGDSGGSNVEYISQEEYEKMMEDLGI